jgi:regulatory protein
MGPDVREEAGEEGELRRAKNIAVRVLSRRALSSQELEQKLTKKGVTVAAAHAVREYFVACGYIDDRSLAFDLARRLVESKGWGYARIVSALRARGLAPELASAATAQLKEEFIEEETARRIMERRFSHFDFEQATPREKQRVVQFLSRRGFSWETIARVVRR